MTLDYNQKDCPYSVKGLRLRLNLMMTVLSCGRFVWALRVLVSTDSGKRMRISMSATTDQH